jgi:hypothetical protein
MKTLMVALLAFFALTSVAAAPSRDCLSQAQAAKVYPDNSLKCRQVGSVRCWFAGRRRDKSEFKIARANAERRATRGSGEEPAKGMFDYDRTVRLGYTGRTPRAHNAQSYFGAATARNST